MEKYPHTLAFSKHFLRYLEQLRQEITLFESDAQLWEVRGAVTNSAGNLTLHLVGNLKCYLGATLLHTDYVRQRDLEFSTKGLSKAALLVQLDETVQVVQSLFDSMTDVDLYAEYPLAFGGEQGSTQDYLLRFLWHFGYHLGQVNSLRRVLSTAANA